MPTPIVSPLWACISLQKCATSSARITSGFALATTWSLSFKIVTSSRPGAFTERPSITIPKSPNLRSTKSGSPMTCIFAFILIRPVNRSEGFPQQSSPFIDRRNFSSGRRNVGSTACQLTGSPGTIDMVGLSELGRAIKSWVANGSTVI